MKKGLHITDERGSIDHELRWDGGKKIEWVAPDGSVRIPEESSRDYRYPGVFMAAGKLYVSWKQLCVFTDESGYFARDIYGRDVFCMRERFPCFDSYDYANEHRYYRWFFIRTKDRLTRVYHADERRVIQVTEDVHSLENACIRKMQEQGWLK